MVRAKSISIITLGVENLEKSIAFYEKLGWECSPESDPAICTYMLTDNIVLGLVPYEFLGNDAGLKVTKTRILWVYTCDQWGKCRRSRCIVRNGRRCGRNCMAETTVERLGRMRRIFRIFFRS